MLIWVSSVARWINTQQTTSRDHITQNNTSTTASQEVLSEDKKVISIYELWLIPVVRKNKALVLPEKTEEYKPSPQDLLRAEFIRCRDWNYDCTQDAWYKANGITKPIVKKKTWNSVVNILNRYISKYWLSSQRVHRIISCESWYNPCAKYPHYMSQNCSVWSRSFRKGWSAAWVAQFTNETWDERSYKAWRWWYDKYHAEANIATATLMMSRGMRGRRDCK